MLRELSPLDIKTQGISSPEFQNTHTTTDTKTENHIKWTYGPAVQLAQAYKHTGPSPREVTRVKIYEKTG